MDMVCVEIRVEVDTMACVLLVAVVFPLDFRNRGTVNRLLLLALQPKHKHPVPFIYLQERYPCIGFTTSFT